MSRLLRKLALVMVMPLVLGSQSGCTKFNYHETEDLEIASGLAIDLEHDGKIRVTAEIDGSKPGKEAETTAVYLTAIGDNVNDATRNLLKYADKTIFLGHMELIVVSQKIARNRMSEVTDLAMRLPNVRLGLTLAVSKMPTAAQVLTMKNEQESTSMNSDTIVNSIEVQNRLGKVTNTKLYQYLDQVLDEGHDPSLASIGIGSDGETHKLEVVGVAAFNDIWFAGFLDEIETRSLMIATNQHIAPVLPLPQDKEGNYMSAAVEIIPRKVSINPVYKDGRVEASIVIHSDLNINDISGASNDIRMFKTITDEISRDASMLLESQIYALVEKTKEMNSTDVLGIGNRLQDDDPQNWKKITGKWRDVYRDMKLTVVVNMKLCNAGNIQNPLTQEH